MVQFDECDLCFNYLLPRGPTYITFVLISKDNWNNEIYFNNSKSLLDTYWNETFLINKSAYAENNTTLVSCNNKESNLTKNTCVR